MRKNSSKNVFTAADMAQLRIQTKVRAGSVRSGAAEEMKK